MTTLRTILLAEDSPADAEMAIDALEEARLANPIVHVEDGVEVMDYLLRRGAFANREEGLPAVLLLDIKMPRMDGYELATAMRADPRYREVPIVMITSRSGDKHRQRAFEIGVQRYLGKPYQELDLMRNVYDLLGIARVRE
ncbi:hypothetical protein G6F50_015098 [Rhizopus delemar]|uniref:Response regulatory domain-containing protein n=1 Tax=Rhizopus delemar TaxID=936053 RepID=A0A9P7C5I6_9FUNG|nr:hypothetical protein G6F50_015098 [Rhizopus delemar]